MANTVLQKLDTANQKTWKSTGGSALFTPTSLGSAAGRQGAYLDLGTGSIGRTFSYRAWMKPGGTRVVGEYVDVYLGTSDGTNADNDDGSSDQAVSSIDKLRNLRGLKPIIIDENAAVTMVSSGTVVITHQWVFPVFWNRSANSLSATATDFGFLIVPFIDEIQ